MTALYWSPRKQGTYPKKELTYNAKTPLQVVLLESLKWKKVLKLYFLVIILRKSENPENGLKKLQ